MHTHPHRLCLKNWQAIDTSQKKAAGMQQPNTNITVLTLLEPQMCEQQQAGSLVHRGVGCCCLCCSCCVWLLLEGNLSGEMPPAKVLCAAAAAAMLGAS